MKKKKLREKSDPVYGLSDLFLQYNFDFHLYSGCSRRTRHITLHQFIQCRFANAKRSLYLPSHSRSRWIEINFKRYFPDRSVHSGHRNESGCRQFERICRCESWIIDIRNWITYFSNSERNRLEFSVLFFHSRSQQLPSIWSFCYNSKSHWSHNNCRRNGKIENAMRTHSLFYLEINEWCLVFIGQIHLMHVQITHNHIYYF